MSILSQRTTNDGGEAFASPCRAAQLIAAWKKVFPSGEIKPAAFLWMQGEADARVPELARDYLQHLTHLIVSLRRDLDAPQMRVVIAGINPAKVAPVSPFPFVDDVRAAQRGISPNDPLTICISTDGLTKAKDRSTTTPQVSRVWVNASPKPCCPCSPRTHDDHDNDETHPYPARLAAAHPAPHSRHVLLQIGIRSEGKLVMISGDPWHAEIWKDFTLLDREA